MKQEIRVYGISLDRIYDGLEHQRIVEFRLSDEEFIEIAESHGLVWSLKGFEHQYNIDDIKSDTFIRVI
jgi:hypothetical protein